MPGTDDPLFPGCWIPHFVVDRAFLHSEHHVPGHAVPLLGPVDVALVKPVPQRQQDLEQKKNGVKGQNGALW